MTGVFNQSVKYEPAFACPKRMVGARAGYP
jgi:hypothetical protein